MDRAIVRKLNAEFAKAVQAPEMRPVWQNIGADPIVMTPEEFEAATAAEIAKLAPVVRASGAKIE
jgi:tripartite-type tricarboxylate transporter receptor subunit TctC